MVILLETGRSSTSVQLINRRESSRRATTNNSAEKPELFGSVVQFDRFSSKFGHNARDVTCPESIGAFGAAGSKRLANQWLLVCPTGRCEQATPVPQSSHVQHSRKRLALLVEFKTCDRGAFGSRRESTHTVQ